MPSALEPGLCAAHTWSPTDEERGSQTSHGSVAGINIPEPRPRKEYPQFQPLFQPSLIPCLYSATSEKNFAHVVNYFYEACFVLYYYYIQMC